MESAVSECEQYFVITTTVVGRSDTADQVRQADCQTLHQVEENFNMTMQGRLELMIGVNNLHHHFNQLYKPKSSLMPQCSGPKKTSPERPKAPPP